MSSEQLRASGLFHERSPQYNGTICFQVLGNGGPISGASVYALPNGELHIRVKALELGKFPNNDELHHYIIRHSDGTLRGRDNAAHAYRLDGHHVGSLIEIVRQ